MLGSSGQYYKHFTLVNFDSRIVINDSRVVIYKIDHRKEF